jgi:hypothetical protein
MPNPGDMRLQRGARRATDRIGWILVDRRDPTERLRSMPAAGQPTALRMPWRQRRHTEPELRWRRRPRCAHGTETARAHVETPLPQAVRRWDEETTMGKIRQLSSAVLVAASLAACPAAPGHEPRNDDSESTGTRTDGIEGWTCNSTGGGTTPSPTGAYYATSFGCWLDANGHHRGDGGDNCVPWCIDQPSDICGGQSGKACEEALGWYAANERRFGCGMRLQVTNPKNGKSVVVIVIDRGPSCSVEKKVSHWVLDLSYPSTNYLFGSPQGATDKALVDVVEVPATTPLGPATQPPPAPDSGEDDGPTADPCGGISYEGRCDGDTVSFCDGEQLHVVDCAPNGLHCGWNAARSYYDCIP